MACRLLYLFVAFAFLFPTAALAQRGQQAVDILLQQADRELQRQQQLQQQRELERAQRQQELNRRQQQFATLRQACISGNNSACEHALTFPNLSGQTRHELQWQINANNQVREDAERMRQQRVEAELAERNRLRQQEQDREQAQQRAIEQQAAAERARRQSETQAVAARPTSMAQVNAQLTTSALASTIDI